jgi:hypothetical protein
MMSWRKRLFGTITISALLASVFFLYTQPEFMVQMANQLWSCF